MHGSGPSAYISMFKAQVRQEIEVNNIKRERSSQKVKASGTSVTSTKDSAANNKPKQKRRRRSAGDDPWVAVAPDPRIKAALNKEPRPQEDELDVNEPPLGRRSMAGTTEERYLRAIQTGSDDPLENLPSLGRKFLAWAGITDPEEFVNSSTKELAESFTKYRRIANMSVLNGSGAAAYCGAWKSQVRKQLVLQEEFGMKKETTTNDDDGDDESDIVRIHILPRKRKHRSSAVTDVEVSTPTKKMARKDGNQSNSSTTKSTNTSEDNDAGGIDENGENVENNDTKNDVEVKETTSRGGRRRVTTDRFGY